MRICWADLRRRRRRSPKLGMKGSAIWVIHLAKMVVSVDINSLSFYLMKISSKVIMSQVIRFIDKQIIFVIFFNSTECIFFIDLYSKILVFKLVFFSNYVELVSYELRKLLICTIYYILFIWFVGIFGLIWLIRECVSTDAWTHRSLGHHLLHWQILRFLVLHIETHGFWGPELFSIERTAPADPNS